MCGLFELAEAFEQTGQPDSALAAYETLVTQPAPFRIWTDARGLAPTFQRLGELYEAKGDRARARDYYGRFVDLWRGAAGRCFNREITTVTLSVPPRSNASCTSRRHDSSDERI